MSQQHSIPPLELDGARPFRCLDCGEVTKQGASRRDDLIAQAAESAEQFIKRLLASGGHREHQRMLSDRAGEVGVGQRLANERVSTGGIAFRDRGAKGVARSRVGRSRSGGRNHWATHHCRDQLVSRGQRARRGANRRTTAGRIGGRPKLISAKSTGAFYRVVSEG